MIKRLSTLVLSILMALSMLPLTATAVEDDHVCYLSSTGKTYATVAEAVENAADVDTVVMVDSSKETDYVDLGTKSITIEGNGYTIDSTALTGSNPCQFYNGKGDGSQEVTIRDATLKAKIGFYMYPCVLTVQGCTVETEMGKDIYLREQSKKAHSVSIIKSSWTSNVGRTQNPFVLIGKNSIDCIGSITLSNSTVSYYSESSEKNGAMFDVYTLGEVDVNIDDQSRLTLLGSVGKYFFYLAMDNQTNIKLGSGSELAFGGDATSVALTNFENANITDCGATWKNDSRNDVCVTLPTVARENAEGIGWKNGDSLYPIDTKTVTLAKGSEMRALFLSDTDFVMENGAALRTVKGELGIRFTSLISNRLWTDIGESATYKTYVVPLSEGEADPVGETLKDKLVIAHENENENYKEGFMALHGAIIMNPEDVSEEMIYSLSLSARTEMLITYADGSEKLVYTAFDMKENTRSMSQVAYNLENYHNVTNAVTRHMLNVCPYVAE